MEAPAHGPKSLPRNQFAFGDVTARRSESARTPLARGDGAWSPAVRDEVSFAWLETPMATKFSAADFPGGAGTAGPGPLARSLGATSGSGGEWLDLTVSRFASHLNRDGLHVALGYLNSKTRFRYTGAYRFAPPLLCSIEIFDRENPSLALCTEVEMDTTYCSIVASEREPLAVDNAEHDLRVSTHPAREQFAAYCGVPLCGPDGESFGTLCHYDPRPRIGSCDQVELLARVAPLVADYITSRTT